MTATNPVPSFDNPLTARYASPEMVSLWSPQHRARIWRELWLALAEAQHELGLPVQSGQLDELRDHLDDIDWERVAAHEKRIRHDVMAHLHAFGECCPKAKPILHWGATSCYITDNADLILLRESLRLVLEKTVCVLARLADFAQRYRELPCLGMTHLQPAQPTTLGKRASLWAYDLVLDTAELEHRLNSLAARSVRGTTGTMASFLALFDGNHGMVLDLQRRVAAKMGFESTYAVIGQTYPRKVDSQILDTLSGVSQSAHKMASDVRILAHRRELEEPFESEQVGSSAMAYKRNPMRCERICGLARFVMSLPANAAATAASQWMERTLDDSANRRLVLPQAFLATDAVLGLYENVARGLVVYPAVIERNLQAELPFMASENILMATVAAGGDRQVLHERIRQHSQAAAARIKAGHDNDLLRRLQQDPAFAALDLAATTNASQFIGCAPQQVDAFCREQVDPLLMRYPTAAEWRYEPGV